MIHAEPACGDGRLGVSARGTGAISYILYSAAVTASRAGFLSLGLTLGLVASLACDRKWDFECTAVWEQRDGKELSREVYTYTQMADENTASARCKEQMLEARPKRGKSATCHCVGKE